MSPHTSAALPADTPRGGGFIRTALRKLRRALPTRAADAVNGLRDYLYDARRFVRHSTALRTDRDRVALEALITKDYHRIEKGLALPTPRAGFGESSVAFLAANVPTAENAFGASLATRSARGAMRVYVERHRELGDPAPGADAFVAGDPDPTTPSCGGVVAVTRAEIEDATAFDFARFVQTRHSVRRFTGEPVSAQEVATAVSVALKTPCVCNRESRRVHVALDPADRARMLSFQNGNRGFGHLAGAVLTVTSDLRCFSDFGERNQCWIDGGLFAMSLVYALHAQQLGSCMLNWSAPSWRDRKMRTAMGVEDHEAVITMIAVGRLPERLEVAASPRPIAGDVLRFLGDRRP